MRERKRIQYILIGVLSAVLLFLVARSLFLLQLPTLPPPPKPAEVSQAPSQPPQPPQQPPQKELRISLALPPRNPFVPLVKEKGTAPSAPKGPSVPKVPALLIPGEEIPQGATSQETPLSLSLKGTVVGPRKVAIVEKEGKSLILTEGEKVGEWRLVKIERKRIVLEGMATTYSIEAKEERK